MGRAMLIISAGAVIALGILQLGIQNQRAGITENSAISAYDVEIRNKAFTAAQLTMERINESAGSWHPTESSPWVEEIDGDSISLYYNLMPSSTTGTFATLEGDTVEIHAKSWYRNPLTDRLEDIEIITSYTKTSMHFVPEFESAMAFAADADEFTFSSGGNAAISGNDASGTCPSKPAVTVRDTASADKINSGSGTITSDTVGVGIDSNLSYEPVDDLVARLSQMDGVVDVPSGTYNDDLGTAEDPGVFFVEGDTKFASNTQGHGILVVRNYGTVTGDTTGSLDLKGGFTFNGLVIFENAYNMDGKGTVNINGSVLVGKTEESTSNLDIDLGGTIDIQYDCTAEKYAQLASASLLNQNRYKRLSTFE